MGSTSRTGRAVINPSAPEAVGVCDRCGNLWNLSRLRNQWQWQGTALMDTGVKVCPDCYDVPQPQLRTIILPPDPLPRLGARPEPYFLDEVSHYTLRGVIGHPFMFTARAAMECALTTAPNTGLAGMVEGFDAMSAALALGAVLVAAVGDAGAVTCELTLVANGDLVAAVVDTGTVSADLEVVRLIVAAISDTGSVSCDLDHTAAGNDLLQEDSSKLLLEDLSPIVLDTGIPALPAAGALTGTEQITVVQGGVTERTTLAALAIKLRGY